MLTLFISDFYTCFTESDNSVRHTDRSWYLLVIAAPMGSDFHIDAQNTG